MTEMRVPDESRLDDIDRLLKSLNERHCELSNSTRVALSRLAGMTEKLEGNVKHLLEVCDSYPDSDWDADLTTLKERFDRFESILHDVATRDGRDDIDERFAAVWRFLAGPNPAYINYVYAGTTGTGSKINEGNCRGGEAKDESENRV